MTQLPLINAIPRFKENEERVDKLTNGTAVETWQTSGGVTLPTFAKFLADKNAEIDGAVETVYEARDEAEAAAIAAAASAASVVDFIEIFDPQGIEDDAFNRENHTGVLPKSAGALMQIPPKLKFVYTADFQPITSAQLVNVQQLTTSIATLHPDLDALIYNGDLVDAGDNSRPPEYNSINWGFTDFLELTTTLVPIDRLFPLGGNHDINYDNDGNQPQHAARMHEYLKFFDKLFYYTLWGNVLRIHMSAMARNTAGNITDYVMQWCKDLVANHQWCAMIEVHIHQPWQNTVQGSTTVGGSQLQTSRWTDWAGDEGYRVDVVMSGHSGADSNNPAVSSEITINGVRYVGLDMNSGVDEENPESGTYDSSYVVAEYIHGATSVIYNRINVETGMVSKTWEVNTVAPIQNAAEPRHDGRTHSDSRYDIFTTKKSIFVTPDRVFSDPDWVYPTNTTVLELGIEDRNDEMEIGKGVSIDVYLPGSNTGSSSQNQPNINHAYGYGGRIRYARTSGGERSFGSIMELYSAVSGDSAGDEYTEAQLRLGLTMRPSQITLHTGDDEVAATPTLERLRINTNIMMFRTSASGGSAQVGYVFGQGGDLSSFRSGTASQWHYRVYNDALVSPVSIGGVASEGTRVKFHFNSASAFFSGGAGSPEGSITAPVGSVWMDTTNGVQYNKKTGTGNTGWKLVTQAA